MTSGIFIVLAVHNGEKFLDQQLASLQQQTEQNWSLLIRDDGSRDESREIISRFAALDPRIQFLQPADGPSKSAVDNFSILIEEAYTRGARYLFCCDQDDVWQPDKVATQHAHLVEAEGDGSIPALVHHDLRVVDEELRPRAHSYWRLARLAPGNESSPQRLLSRNEVTGCALACNRALLDYALPIPEQAIMHDWWLALHAGFRGRLVSLPQTLVDYRQHPSNVIGAKSYYSGLSPLQNWAATWRRGNTEFLETVRQARAFRYSIAGQGSLEPGLSEILDCYCELPYLNRTQRLSALRRCSVWRHNPLLDAVLVLRTLLLPGSNH